MQLRFELVQPQSTPSASVIWLHGLGASGHDFHPVVPLMSKLSRAPVRFLFPHAPQIPVTINGGLSMPAWYDILALDLDAKQDEAGLEASRVALEELIQQEVDLGIPRERILLIGFSQGGALALHTAYRQPYALAGVGALSTYLPLHTRFPRALNGAAANVPTFMAHGEFDPVVPLFMGKASHDVLVRQNIPVSWHEYPIDHSVSDQEIEDLDSWAYDKLGFA